MCPSRTATDILSVHGADISGIDGSLGNYLKMPPHTYMRTDNMFNSKFMAVVMVITML